MTIFILSEMHERDGDIKAVKTRGSSYYGQNRHTHTESPLLLPSEVEVVMLAALLIKGRDHGDTRQRVVWLVG